MESLCDVGPGIECRDGFPGDLESATDFLEELVCKRVRIIAFDAARKSKVSHCHWIDDHLSQSCLLLEWFLRGSPHL